MSKLVSKIIVRRLSAAVDREDIGRLVQNGYHAFIYIYLKYNRIDK